MGSDRRETAESLDKDDAGSETNANHSQESMRRRKDDIYGTPPGTRTSLDLEGRPGWNPSEDAAVLGRQDKPEAPETAPPTDPGSLMDENLQLASENVRLRQDNATLLASHVQVSQTAGELRLKNNALQLELEQFHKAALEQISKTKTEAARDREGLLGQLLGFSQEKQALRESVRRLEAELKVFRAERAQLESDLQHSYAKGREDENRINTLLRELHDQGRDRTRTSASDDGDLRPDVIHRDLANLRDNEFRAAADRIFLHLANDDPAHKRNRKPAVAGIKAVLQKHTLTDVGKQRRAEIIAKGLEELLLSAGSQCPPPEHTKRLARAVLDSVENRQSQSTAAAPDPVRAIVADLRGSSPLDPELVQMLEDLAARGESLVGRISRTFPPGTLWTAGTSETYDPERHELQPGCQDWGPITHTTFPGYSTAGVLYAKAVVFTAPLVPSDLGQAESSG